MKILLSSFIIFIIIYTFAQEETSISKQYELLDTLNNVEIRAYKESTNASYYSDLNSKKNNYFRNLASYIFGGNSEKKNINMTSPVTMRLYGKREMIFRMPDGFSIESLPKADNPSINLIVIPSCVKATIKYGGYTNNKIENKKINELINVLAKNKIKHNNKFEVLVYNSPYKIINRKNEIAVNITYP